jgi:hypothetical protein
MSSRPGLIQSLVPIVLATLAIAGCALSVRPSADVVVANIATAFPAIERLSAVIYLNEEGSDGEPGCEYFVYVRGAFTSKPTDQFCRVFDFDDRQPGGGDAGPSPVEFDDLARADLADLKVAFERVGAPLKYLNLVIAPNGSVGPDSVFDFDGCIVYWYRPGWTVLPVDESGDSVSTGIDEDWYETDNCR